METRYSENLIIGAGPAGLAAAVFGPTGSLILEARNSPGWKILIAANSRCNVTNTFAPAEFLRRMLSGGRQLKTALGSFPTDAVRSWLSTIGCPTVVENDWEVYPKSHKASDVLAALLSAAGRNSADVVCDARVTAVYRGVTGFSVETREVRFQCERLLVAAGTPAWSRHGQGLDESLRNLGHSVREWVPGLCPIPLAKNPFKDLDGISFTGRLTVAERRFDADEMVFTDEGLSGPGALNPSAAVFRRFREEGKDEFHLDLAPSSDEKQTADALLASRGEGGKRDVWTALAEFLPKRLAMRLVDAAGLSRVSRAQLRREAAEKLARFVHAFPCRVAGMPSTAKGFVASGGVLLDEVNMKTMESKVLPGLFFAGEILDYDAPSGGFNITIALATGRLAGLHLAGKQHNHRG